MVHVELVTAPDVARGADGRARIRALVSDAVFVLGCVAGSFGFGWCWSLVEWWMRVDIRV